MRITLFYHHTIHWWRMQAVLASHSRPIACLSSPLLSTPFLPSHLQRLVTSNHLSDRRLFPPDPLPSPRGLFAGCETSQAFEDLSTKLYLPNSRKSDTCTEKWLALAFALALALVRSVQPTIPPLSLCRPIPAVSLYLMPTSHNRRSRLQVCAGLCCMPSYVCRPISCSPAGRPGFREDHPGAT